MTANAELEPRFLVTVTLDGDDDAETQTQNARRALGNELLRMVDDGTIRAYTIEQAP